MTLFRSSSLFTYAVAMAAIGVAWGATFLREETRPQRRLSSSGKGSKGKGGSNSYLPPTCGQGSRSSKSIKSSKGSKGSKDGKGSSYKNSGEIQVGDTIENEVVLQSSLICPFPASGHCLTVSGPDAVLDCAGEMITTNELADFGILVEKGGTVKNCNVSNFGVGISVGEGDNTVMNTKVSNNGVGISVQGKGCDTIASVEALFNLDGIYIYKQSGTVAISDYRASLNDVGIRMYKDREGTTNLAITDTFMENNYEEGLLASADTLGEIQIGFYGSNTIALSGASGVLLYETAGSKNSATIYGSLETFGNGAFGITGDDGTTTTNVDIFMLDDSTTISCNSADLSLGPKAVYNISERATVVCDDSATRVACFSCPDYTKSALCEA